MTAIVGCTAARNAADEDVELPWWGTLSTSAPMSRPPTAASPAASMSAEQEPAPPEAKAEHEALVVHVARGVKARKGVEELGAGVGPRAPITRRARVHARTAA